MFADSSVRKPNSEINQINEIAVNHLPYAFTYQRDIDVSGTGCLQGGAGEGGTSISQAKENCYVNADQLPLGGYQEKIKYLLNLPRLEEIPLHPTPRSSNLFEGFDFCVLQKTALSKYGFILVFS